MTALATLATAISLLAGHHAEQARADARQLDPATLQAAVSAEAGRHVDIEVAPMLPGSWSGGAFPGIPWLIIGHDAYEDARTGGGHGLMVLLHEVGHVTGIENEAEANCFALARLPGFWLQVWGERYDRWAGREMLRTAYHDAGASMLQQSGVYHCSGYAPTF